MGLRGINPQQNRCGMKQEAGLRPVSWLWLRILSKEITATVSVLLVFQLFQL